MVFDRFPFKVKNCLLTKLKESSLYKSFRMSSVNYTTEQTYNADESGLYWKLLPRKTLAADMEKSAPGYKVSKDRVMIMGCANAAETHRLPPVVIGKSRNPRCFKHVNMENLTIHYLNQSIAWMSGELFSR
uniref:Tigger transposable element-derived protein 2-like n=1 Tax=Saccoglossus kowalevskii TaxID=10224 RepID=A0ABM0LVQ3_SACKO|nr:PREDICTED: tigger transposable element-derived protein 2-like [Saccoglossus kowalevskii]